jgi:phosphatidylglycerophosphate synthase
VVVALAFWSPSPTALGACLIIAFLSDVCDGILARHLKVVTPALRRLDSAADTLFYLAVALCIWHLEPQALRRRADLLAALLLLEVTRYALDALRFAREASYHTLSAKLFGLALFAGCFSVLALGKDNATLTAALWCGIFCDLEGIAISLTLRRWRTDVPTLWHALKARQTPPETTHAPDTASSP